MGRREERYATLSTALMSGREATGQAVVVRNISKSGACIIVPDAGLVVGDTVSLDFGDGDVKTGSVRWITDTRHGISFS